MGLFGKRFKHPVRGTAQVIASPHPPDGSMYAANVKLQLVVRADGMDPYATDHRAWKVPVKKWPWPGNMLPVTVDLRDPDKLKIEWDEVRTTREIARGRAEAMAAGEGSSAWGGAENDPDVEAAIQQVQAARPDMDVDELIEQVKKIAPDATISVESSTIGSGAAGGSDGGEDRLAQLERLADLHKSGALSDAEFELEKSRILGRA